MPERTEYPAGMPCWIELATSDAEASKRFYSEVFGWQWEDMDAGAAGTYSIMRMMGKDVAGLFQLPTEQQQQGATSGWTTYVSVSNCDETTARVEDLGGSVVADPFDVMGMGRMSVLEDPTGARISLWQSKGYNGAHLVNENCTWTWNDLVTDDPATATKFYTNLFGWHADEYDMGGTTSVMFKNGDDASASIGERKGEWTQVPQGWLTFFWVDDCDATVQKVVPHGGQAILPATDRAYGRSAVIQDPTGAHFAIITPSIPAPE